MKNAVSSYPSVHLSLSAYITDLEFTDEVIVLATQVVLDGITL